MASTPTNRGSELLNQIEAIINDELKYGADGLGKRVATQIAFQCGGSKVYFPFDKARRDARIYDDFTGDNIQELRTKYHLSEQTVYQIIREERARRKHKQSVLPGVSLGGE